YRRNQRDEIVTDVPNVRRIIYSKPVSELHQRGWRARLRGMDSARYVRDGGDLGDELVGDRVIHLDAARICQPAESGFVAVETCEQRFGCDSDCDHPAPFFALAN